MEIGRTALEDTLKTTGIFVIDGSMGTALEMLGCDLNHSLWTARVLADRPELVYKVHYDYFKAGADCGISCSYQATVPGLTEAGYTEAEAERIISDSVRILRKAREDWWKQEGEASGRAYPLALGAVGPYGAYLADGSEYRGNYGVSDEVLREFHQRRMELLWGAGADLLLLETQPSLREARIEADIAERLGADYWISFTCKDGLYTCEGDRLEECAKVLSSGYPHLKMIGVNCTAPVFLESLIGELKKGTSLPIGVYPNSGEEYDAATKTWHGSADSLSFGEYAARWMNAGASAVGGCCRTVASHIEQVEAARDRVLESRQACP